MWNRADTFSLASFDLSAAFAEKRCQAECTFVYRYLWPRSTQPRAKIIVMCFC